MWKVRGLRVLVPLVRRWPGLAYRLAWVLGWLAWKLQRRTRRNVLRNLLPVCDGDREWARTASLQVFRNIAAYYVDIMALKTTDLARLESERLTVVNDVWLDVLTEHTPVIAVSAHMGNVEVAIQALTARGRPFVAIVEPLQPPEFGEYFMGLRRVAGGDFREATPGGLLGALRQLNSGAILGLMGDRNLQNNGVCVELCGRSVWLPRGPWDVARRTGAAILPVFCTRIDKGRFKVSFEAPYMVPAGRSAEAEVWEAASRWAVLFEKHLRADPGQWTVLEDYWRVHDCSGTPRKEREQDSAAITANRDGMPVRLER